MRMFGLLRLAFGCLAALAWGAAGASTILVAFPEFNGPRLEAGPFPAAPITVASRTFSIPPGDKVTAATISGFWGSNIDPSSTAGVDVRLDGVLVAQCVKKPRPSCYSSDALQQSWSYTLKEGELSVLNDGVATLTATQTSDISIRLGETTLVVTTGTPSVERLPVPIDVPANSPAGLGALLAAMAAAGAFALRRRARSA